MEDRELTFTGTVAIQGDMSKLDMDALSSHLVAAVRLDIDSETLGSGPSDAIQVVGLGLDWMTLRPGVSQTGTPTNIERARRGLHLLVEERRLTGVPTTDDLDDQSLLGDALADLMHHANAVPDLVDFETALVTARMHFDEEVAQEEDDGQS
jgi:hypothetical protein